MSLETRKDRMIKRKKDQSSPNKTNQSSPSLGPRSPMSIAEVPSCRAKVEATLVQATIGVRCSILERAIGVAAQVNKLEQTNKPAHKNSRLWVPTTGPQLYVGGQRFGKVSWERWGLKRSIWV